MNYEFTQQGTETVENNKPLFTDSEMKVLTLIGEGFTNLQIAQELKTSVRTIETRRQNMMSKSNTVNTATLVKFAVLNGLLK